MATQRGRKKESATSLPLVAALNFVESTLNNARNTAQEHCFIGHNQIVATDGCLTVGYPFESDISTYPHSAKLLAALKKCDSTVALTLTDAQRLSVKSGKFRAVIDCLDAGQFYAGAPDAAIAPIDERLRTGLEAIGHLADEKADRLMCATIFIKSGVMVATNGYSILEYWHGNDLPEMVLPKPSANAIVKTSFKLQRFGFSGNSATFYFENGAWIKTQLFADEWPNYAQLFPASCNPWPAPTGLFDAVRAVAPFLDDVQSVYFTEAGLQAASASYELPGLPPGRRYSAARLLEIERCCKTVDFASHPGKAFFFGENVRGVVMGMAMPKAAPQEPPKFEPQYEDDIPF